MNVSTRELIRAAQLIGNSASIVCLTGAGASAESGIPTFREAQTGLWAQFNPEVLASPTGFSRNPGLVWRWYCERLSQVREASPNPGHRALARLASLVPHFQIITQNVDDLHERAGSRDVIHLHGRIDQFRCNRCFEPYSPNESELNQAEPPRCPHCGELVRPDVVWFGENLSGQAVERAVEVTTEADLLISIGTSGIVYPAAHLPVLARESGARLIDINKEAGPLAYQADASLLGTSGDILPALVALIASQSHSPDDDIDEVSGIDG